MVCPSRTGLRRVCVCVCECIYVCVHVVMEATGHYRASPSGNTLFWSAVST